MRRTILATCLAGACAVALSAQTPTQQPPTSTAGTTGATTSDTTAGGTQRSRGGPMTVTGCLKAGDTAGTFMLTNIKGMGMNHPGGTTAGDTTGAGGTTTGGATAGGATAGGTTAGGATTAPHGGQSTGMNEISLTASSSVDLKPHLNHQVEVTGTPVRGSGAGSATTTGAAGDTTGAAGTATGGTAAGGGTTATSGQTGRPRSLNVTSLKMVSESCSQ